MRGLYALAALCLFALVLALLFRFAEPETQPHPETQPKAESDTAVEVRPEPPPTAKKMGVVHMNLLAGLPQVAAQPAKAPPPAPPRPETPPPVRQKTSMKARTRVEGPTRAANAEPSGQEAQPVEELPEAVAPLLKPAHHKREKMVREMDQLPVVQMSYDRIGFNRYLDAVLSAGGHVFLGDANERRLLAEVVLSRLQSGAYRFKRFERNRKPPQGLAMFRPRVVADQELIEEVSRNARVLLRSTAPRFVVYLPVDVEVGLLSGLEKYLASCGHSLKSMDRVWGEYVGGPRGLELHMVRAVSRDNQQIRMHLTLHL